MDRPVALNRPYTFIVVALLILVLAPIVILRTPTDIFPNIDIPVIAVAWQYTGLNSACRSLQLICRSRSAGAEAAIAPLPVVDVLVNKVGIFEPKPYAEIPDADWQRFFEVNVMSGVRLSRHYLAGMLRKNWGLIVFISSESAVQIPPEMVHYGTTKTAQVAVARGIAESVAGTGVTVDSVLAGTDRVGRCG